MIGRFLLGALFACWFNVSAAELIPKGSVWRYVKGISEASLPDRAAWRSPGFNDAGWSTGSAPFYYGEPLAGTDLSDMRGRYTSVYLRKTFVVTDPAAISQLILETVSDDGFVAWINGRQVVRYNVPEGELSFNSVSLGALPEPIVSETTVISNPRELLVPGNNVIAVHAFNSSLSGSTDFVFEGILSANIDQSRPVLESSVPPAGALVRSLNFFEVIFSEEVQNVDADDLLINDVPATNVTELTRAQYIFEFPEPQSGLVRLAWAPDHGIRDLSAASNAFVGPELTVTLDPNLPVPNLLISEFMADNDKTLNDEDGEASDWIEIFNPTDIAVDLEGWFLSNNTNDLARWKFPRISLEPNSYLVVFASEKNRTAPRLHTNFRLPREGGFLALSDSATNPVSVFPSYPAQPEDVSYGRERANPTAVGFFTRPTPGGPNVPGGPGFAPVVEFSRSSGTFTSPFQLVLSTSSTNAVIHYNLGTNLPTQTSAIYTGPITISNTTHVRARAFEPGLLPGEPRSESYIMLAGPTVNFTSDLPIVILHNHGGGSVSATTDRFVMMQVFEPKHGVASMTNAPDVAHRARFRRRGSSTEGLPKGSYAVETWDEFGDDEKIELLGMPAESDWVFYAPNGFEPVLIHNPFMYGLSRDIGRYAPRTRFVEVYLNTGGGAIQQANYAGIYVVEEKIKRGGDRVDVDKLEPEHLREPEVTGGYLLKIDRADPGDAPFNAAGQSINYVDPKGPIIRLPARDAQEQYIRNYFNQFGNVLNGPNFRDPTNGYARFIDVPSWIDHHVLNVLAFNVDALRLSTYFYKPRNGKIEFGPIWDFDRALGSTDGRDANPRVWYNGGGTDFFGYTWWNRLFRDPDFWQKWIDRWEELRLTHFSVTNLNRLIDFHVAQVRNAQPRERARWGVAPRNGSYEGEVNLMKTYLRNRAEWIDGQLVRPPRLNLPSGPITAGTVLTIPQTGTNVYYTLDGSDPRLPRGEISSRALLYTAPIVLQTNARVMARAYSPSHNRAPSPATPSRWSGLVSATYVVATPQLAITEIMYNPVSTPGNTFTNQDFEFVEVKNLGGPVNLQGVTLSGGIQFTFGDQQLESGEYIVVVRNRTVFQSRYGTAIQIAGEFTGGLNNATDRIVLQGSLGEPIADIEFSDTWQPLTDGLGFSLVPRVEPVSAPQPSGATAWRASSNFNGSPGQVDPSPGNIVPVVVNEVMSNPGRGQLDAIELHNPTGSAANIGGWYLTDEFDEPKKYRIPSGRSIPPMGYLLFDESVFSRGSTGFSLSAGGEEVYLFSAGDEGELTGYVHGFVFGAATEGVSFGRHVTTDGRERFPAQAVFTPSAINAGPRFSPVIISEIMFHPVVATTNGAIIDEFIEIQNVSTDPVELFDPRDQRNRWRFRGAIDFDFPPIILPPGGLALVVSFDPGNPVFASGFRARLNVPAGTLLLGPYSGELDDAGETVQLMRPGPAEEDGVPYTVVEEVAYRPGAPWPSGASGTGNSLQRRSTTFADDPVSWMTAPPTPGAGTVAAGISDADLDGLPDDWETTHGLDPRDPSGSNGPNGDPDADGMINQHEFIAGTSPRDATSRLALEIVAVGAGTRTLEFKAAPGISYSIFCRDAFSGDAWRKLADVSPRQEAALVEIRDDSPGTTTRFYRLVTPQQ